MSSTPCPSELLDTAVAAARAGAEVLRRYFGSDELVVDRKAANDFVSQADRESEDAVVGEILCRHPRHRVLAEEGGHRGGDGDFEWIVDPLDGTTNFLQGVPVFCVSVAVRHDGRTLAGAVLDPTRDDLFTATAGGGATRNDRPMRVSAQERLEGAFLATGYPFKAKQALDLYLGIFGDALTVAKAIRRCGSAALDLAYTAAGVYDGFFELRLSPWDLAAGALLIEQAGGVVSDLDGGDRYLLGGNLVAGTRGVHGELLATARRHADEALLDRRVPHQAPALLEPRAEATVG
jgi:myo-inositol-1(or 4)-monophosphatase